MARSPRINTPTPKVVQSTSSEETSETTIGGFLEDGKISESEASVLESLNIPSEMTLGNEQPADPVETPAPVIDPTPPISEDPAPLPPPQDPPVIDSVIEEVVVETTAGVSEDNLQVAQLNALLVEFVIENTRPHSTPAGFQESAKKLVTITNFIIKSPKPVILDAFLAFIKANMGNVSKPENFLKGSTLLSKTDEQRVAFLYNLFRDIAVGSRVALNTNLVTNVLKRPEFIGYYNRQMNRLNRS